MTIFFWGGGGGYHKIGLYLGGQFYAFYGIFLRSRYRIGDIFFLGGGGGGVAKISIFFFFVGGGGGA